MKYLLSSLFTLLLAFGCCVHDDDEPTPLDGIQVRLQNNSSFNLEDASLRFYFGSVEQEYQNYGTLDVGNSTEYRQYPAAGHCSSDFFAIPAGTIDTFRHIPICNCICQLDPGLYTMKLSDIQSGDNIVINAVIEED